MHTPITAADLTRREFLRLSLLSSAAALAPAAFAPAALAADSLPVPWHGALRALPPGAVKPQGWLRDWLQKQADQLGSHLPQISWPFNKDYWGEELQGDYWLPDQEYEEWWPWEQRAYWMDGATRLGVLLDDHALLAQTTPPMEYTLTHADREGYLGPQLFQMPLGDYHRWPHVVFFRALAAAADSGTPLRGISRQQIAAIMERHFLNDSASYGKPKRNVNNIENILWCYGQTGNPRLLSLAENAWREFMQYSDDPENADLGLLRVLSDSPINTHGETYAETAKQPAILYLYTGRQDYLTFGIAAQRRIFDHHMLVDGVPSTSEWFATRTALDLHETCDISDHTWSWGYYLMATGDAAWADRIERACLNAAPGAIRNDWKAVQYFSGPNQFLATLNSDHAWPKFKEHGGSMMAYQPNPGQRTACCGGNVHRILPNYVIRMWMKSADHGLAAVLYGPSTVRAAAGVNHLPVEIVQSTHYPFEEEIRFTLRMSAPVEFPLSLRVPAWCREPRLTLNGSPVNALRSGKGFVTLRRTFQPGDRLTLTLPMHLAVSRWPQQGVALERGPLVYSLPIRTSWTPHVLPRYSTAEFPAWEATPLSDWNYGLAVNEATLERDVAVNQTPLAPDQPLDPWEHPPVSLTVPARKLARWELQSNPGNPAQKFTPGLPDLDAVGVSDTTERIALEPYGSAKLRVTIFPELKNI